MIVVIKMYFSGISGNFIRSSWLR